MTGPASVIILVDLVFLCWIDPPAGWIARQSPKGPTKVPFFISFLAYCICDLLKRGGDRQMYYSDSASNSIPKALSFNSGSAFYQQQDLAQVIALYPSSSVPSVYDK